MFLGGDNLVPKRKILMTEKRTKRKKRIEKRKGKKKRKERENYLPSMNC